MTNKLWFKHDILLTFFQIKHHHINLCSGQMQISAVWPPVLYILSY